MSGLGIAQWASRSVLIEWWETQSQRVDLSRLAEFETPLNLDSIRRKLFVVGLIKFYKFCK